jgi:CSLREA domain-containing protein
MSVFSGIYLQNTSKNGPPSSNPIEIGCFYPKMKSTRRDGARMANGLSHPPENAAGDVVFHATGGIPVNVHTNKTQYPLSEPSPRVPELVLPSRRRSLESVVFLLLGLLAYATVLAGCGGGTSTFVVNDAGDADDSNTGDGVCLTAGGKCTLRAAIQQANANSNLSTIHFNLPAGSLTITLDPSDMLPYIMEPVVIDATTQPGYAGVPVVRLESEDTSGTQQGFWTEVETTIRGMDLSGFDNGIVNRSHLTLESMSIHDVGMYGVDTFQFEDTRPPAATLTIRDSEITAFHAGGIRGQYADITADQIRVLDGQGNGIFMTGGVLDVSHSEFMNIGVGPSGLPSGAGIAMEHAVNAEILTSTLEDNTAREDGGGVYFSSETGGLLDIQESTITGNRAVNGGGVYAENGSLSILDTTIAGNQSSSRGGGILVDTSVGVTLVNLTLEGNTAADMGGGLYYFGHPGSTLTLTESAVRGNTASQGGGMFFPGGVVHVLRSSFVDNRANAGGGGIFVNYTMGDAGTLYVEDSSHIGITGHGNNGDADGDGLGDGAGIYSHGAVYISLSAVEGNTGDGIFNDWGSLRVQDSRVENNTGNGINSFISGTTNEIRIDRSEISGNTLAGILAINAHLMIADSLIQENNSSGISMSGGRLELSRSTIADNHRVNAGGGISAFNLASAEIRESAIWGNSSGEAGGGLVLWAVDPGVLRLENVTIHGNQAGTTGGGLEAGHGAIVLNNVTLTQNTAPSAGGIHSTAHLTVANSILAENTNGNCTGVITSLGYNIENGMSCPLIGPGDHSGTGIPLGPMHDNGGPTYTRAIFSPGPAFDMGNDAACAATDQRGILRPQGAHCDIGAFELGAAPATLSPATPSPTPTATPTPAGKFIFDPLTFSETQIYHGGKTCKVKQVEIRVQVTPWTGIQSVGLFYRLEDKAGGGAGDWSEGLAMTPLGEGWYSHTLAADSIPGIAEWKADAWLAIQIVANGEDYVPLAHSEIRREVTLSPCKDYR